MGQLLSAGSFENRGVEPPLQRAGIRSERDIGHAPVEQHVVERQSPAALILEYAQRKGYKNLIVLTETERDAYTGFLRVEQEAWKQHRPLTAHLQYAATNPEAVVARLQNFSMDAIVLWASGRSAATLIRALRKSGVSVPIIGPSTLVCPELADARDEIGDLIVAAPYDLSRDDADVRAFVDAFRRRTHMTPSAIAAYAYDTACLTIHSIERAGLNRARIRDELHLPCSIGIAPNKLLAKIASDMEKPDGITIIAEKDVANRIWPLPVRKLRGVGPKTEEHLKWMGVETIGDLAALPLENLTGRFGLSYGNYLFEAALGIDDTPLATVREPKSMSRETTFQQDVGNKQVLSKVLAELAGEVASGLKKEGYQGKTVTVKVRYGDFETHTHAKTLSSVTCREDEIRRAAFACFSRFELKKKVRLVGVRVSSLVR